MGRRNRRRNQSTATYEQAQRRVAASGRDHQARVHVADDVWADFKASAGVQPISYRLGEMVEHEVELFRARRAAQGVSDDGQLLEALARAEELEERFSTVLFWLGVRIGRSPRGE